MRFNSLSKDRKAERKTKMIVCRLHGLSQLYVECVYITYQSIPITQGKIHVPSHRSHPQSNQSAGPVHFLIFCSISMFLLASLVAGRRPQCSAGAVQQWMYFTLSDLSTGISNLLQPAQPEVVLSQFSMYLASWVPPVTNYLEPATKGQGKQLRNTHWQLNYLNMCICT